MNVDAMEGLVVVNWKYSALEYNDLEYPERDGELMEALLNEGGYNSTVVLENEEDIETVVKNFVENQDEPLERFHFHYSGKIKVIENITELTNK